MNKERIYAKSFFGAKYYNGRGEIISDLSSLSDNISIQRDKNRKVEKIILETEMINDELLAIKYDKNAYVELEYSKTYFDNGKIEFMTEKIDNVELVSIKEYEIVGRVNRYKLIFQVSKKREEYPIYLYSSAYRNRNKNVLDENGTVNQTTIREQGVTIVLHDYVPFEK